METVRKEIAKGLRRRLSVFFRSGIYELSQPLVFRAEDSGTEAFPVTYAAHGRETVTFSGGRRIEGFEQAKGVWRAALPDVRSGDWFFRHLVVADQRVVRARWPNADGVLRVASVAAGVRDFTLNREIPGELVVGPSTEMVVYQNWSITCGRITAVDGQKVTTATPMGWIGHGNSTTTSVGKPVFLEHARAFLDEPGEWFLDRGAGVLSYKPRPGERLNWTVVVAPSLRQLLRIEGTKAKPVRHLRFRGLRFEHSGFALPAVGYSEIQAAHFGTELRAETFVQPVAIECVYAEKCRFERCRLAHVGASGFGLGVGCRDVVLDGCLIEDIGGNGVMIGWRGKGALGAAREGGLDADWADPTDAPSGNIISNCHVRRCGAESRGGVGIFVAFSTDTRIAHNLVHDLPYTGISVGYRWNTTPTSQKRCVVENNHIHDVMRVLADGGGIYTLGWQPGTVIRGNYIHDVHRSRFAHGGAPNNGFFIDQGSKGFRFSSNVVRGTSGAPVRFNQCKREWHEWDGNFFGQAAAESEGARAVVKRSGRKAAYR